MRGERMRSKEEGGLREKTFCNRGAEVMNAKR
jgi:hypothetical protein